MKKFETIEDLAKAAGQLAGSFTKNAEYHKAAHAAHMGEHAHHEAHAAFHKAAHDAMDDGHEMKAHIGKAHEHHVHKAAFHKAMAEHHQAECDAATKLAAAFGEDSPIQKTAPTTNAATGVSTGAPTSVEGLVADTTKGLVAKSLEMLQTDPAIQDEIRKMVLAGVKASLSGQIVPDNVRATYPSNPDPALLHLVPRAGSGATLEKAQVEPENEAMFAGI